ncbi:MAG: hypothetical protein U1F83_16795 [Verrucomicrobiota bacterium]
MPPTQKLLTSSKARNAALVNQLATPGLGSLIAGRYVSGGGQLALAVTGFMFFLFWFIAVMRQFYGQIEGNVEVKPVGWIGWTGLAVFAASWLWSLVTSISLLREARRNQAALFANPQPPPLP